MEVELTRKDYREIWDLAHREWLHSADTDKDMLLCKVYAKSFCSWLAGKKLTVVNGKIYHETTNQAEVQPD